jgi:hypothetical protein
VRPLSPGIYFRLLLIGYFEGIDSERGIAWRTADSGDDEILLGPVAGYCGRDGGSTVRLTSRCRRISTCSRQRSTECRMPRGPAVPPNLIY